MTPDAFRRLAMSFPQTHEEPHFERTSFRVGKKIFATMTAGGDEAMVKVVPRERALDLIAEHPKMFFSYGGWTERNGSLGVHLPKVDKRLLRELMLSGWSSIAPKRAREALSAGGG